LVAVGALGYWVAGGGIGRAIDKNFKRGFDETGAAKVQIHEQFHGSCKLVAKIQPDGVRESVEDSDILELSGDSLSRRKMDGTMSSFDSETVYILDDGALWVGGDPGYDDTHIADLRVDDSELHFVAVLDGHHLIYERLETELAEQGTRRPATAVDSESQDKKKPKPESEGRSE
jgi:hypothetical protein